VIATRVGQIPRMIEHGREGLLVDPEDASGLTTALEALRDDPGLRRQMGEAGRAKVEAQHTWRGVVDRVFELASLRRPATDVAS
jgi:glycosyltransferase involved in cell wall biosynthesis